MISETYTFTGTYFGKTSGTGGAGGFNIISLHNPATSTALQNLILRRVFASYNYNALVNAGAGPFNANLVLSRTSGALPSGGSSVTIAKRRTADAAPFGVCLAGPAATPGADLSWHPLIHGPVELFRGLDIAESIVLAPGEGLVVRVDAALGATILNVSLEWHEGQV